MDYSESIIYLRSYTNKVAELLNRRKYKAARDTAAEILAEAQQLVQTIDNAIEANGGVDEQVR